jgi:hypothetical protein
MTEIMDPLLSLRGVLFFAFKRQTGFDGGLIALLTHVVRNK